MDRVSMMNGIKLENDCGPSPSLLDKNASPHRLIDNTCEDWPWKPLDSYLQPISELWSFRESLKWPLDVFKDSTHHHNTPSTLANRLDGELNLVNSVRPAVSIYESINQNFGVNFAFKAYNWMSQNSVICSDFNQRHLARAAGLKTSFNHDIVYNSKPKLADYSNDSTVAWLNAANQFATNEAQHQKEFLSYHEQLNAPSPAEFTVQQLNNHNGNMFNRGHYLEEAYIDTVTVDSSTVAQIVGKNGVKIIEVATKFKTIIKCPKEGELPVFGIRGERNAVLATKEEILRLEDRFMAIELSRNNQLHTFVNRSDWTMSQLHMPPKHIGKLIGENCCHIEKLQNENNIFVITPKLKFRVHHFVILGAQENIDKTIERLWIQLCNRTGISFRKFYANANEVHFVAPPTFDPL